MLPMACVNAVATVIRPLWVFCGWLLHRIIVVAGVAPVSVGEALLARVRAGAGTFPKIIRARHVVAGRGNESCAPLTMSVGMRCLRKFTKAAAVPPSSY